MSYRTNDPSLHDDPRPAPGWARLLSPSIIVGAVVILVAGVILGAIVLRPADSGTVAQPGSLVEIRTGDGSWLVGVLVSEDSEVIRLSSPAEVRQVAAPSGSTQYQVAMLSGDPYQLAGDAVIARAQVAWLGNVAAGSSLESAYASVLQASLASPTPGTSATP